MPTVHENKLRVGLADTIADATLAEITDAEITASTELTDWLNADGYNPSHTQNTASIAKLSGFVATNIGTRSLTFTLRGTYEPDDTGVDTTFDYFDESGKRAVMWVSRIGAPAAGNRVELYPVEVSLPMWIASGENTHQQYEVTVTVHQDYELAATVAAGV